MARVSTYLNFPGTTEDAFNFYRSVFGGEFIGPIARFGDMPSTPDQPELPPEAKNLILHIELRILGGHVLMATDAVASMGFTVAIGNNTHINLEPDTREEAERLFNGLSVGGQIEMPLQDMFWGAYYGSFVDRFGIHWMVNHAPKN
jgi:PhnB protein